MKSPRAAEHAELFLGLSQAALETSAASKYAGHDSQTKSPKSRQERLGGSAGGDIAEWDSGVNISGGNLLEHSQLSDRRIRPGGRGDSSASEFMASLKVVPCQIMVSNFDAGSPKIRGGRINKINDDALSRLPNRPPNVMFHKPDRARRAPSNRKNTNEMTPETETVGRWHTVDNKREFVIPLGVFGVTDQDYRYLEDEAGRRTVPE